MRRFCFVFPSKLPTFWHITEVSFDRKCMKIVDIPFFYNEKSDSVFRFSLKQPNIRKYCIKMNAWVNFRKKRDEKVVREKKYLLKLEFFNTVRKMKNIIRCLFISVIMHPNFTHIRQKIRFKSALEIFTPVTGQSRTALTCVMHSKIKNRTVILITIKSLSCVFTYTKIAKFKI